MKKILTLVTHDEAETAEAAAPEQVEIIGTGKGKNLYESIKQAKGRYTALTDCDTECELCDALFGALGGENADLVLFNEGYCFKTSVLKGVAGKNCTDKFRAEIYAAFACKSVARLDFKPFSFIGRADGYTQEDDAALYEVLDEFTKIKAKLGKDVYSFAFELISDKIINYYSGALIAIYCGALGAEKLAEFDGKLKENVVLYLAVEKRLLNEGIKLKNIRKNNYKISFLTANKLKKRAAKKHK